MKRLRLDERGAAVAEFVFVAPLLMLLFAGAVQIGLAVVASSAGTNAAREAARTAAVRYECADNHVSTRCPVSPSTNYTAIKTAALSKLGGLVPTGSLTVSVQCRQNSVTGTIVSCEKSTVRPDNDVVVVTVNWSNLGASKWVPVVAHSSKVVMSIVGRPDLASLAPEPDAFPPGLALSNGIVAKDVNVDGIMDRIELTFDEDIQQSVSASAFTLANSVTGSNTITSASVSGRVVTLTLSGSAPNTAVGSMTLSLAASAAGVRDITGNQASFTNVAPVDKASPVLRNVSDQDGVVNGRIDLLDSITFSFSEPIANVPSSVTVVEADPSGPGNDTFQVTGLMAGPSTTNSTSYVVPDGTTVTVTGASITASNGNKDIKVTVSLLQCLLNNCLLLGTGNDSAAWSVAPSASLVDAAGNSAAGSRLISNVF